MSSSGELYPVRGQAVVVGASAWRNPRLRALATGSGLTLAVGLCASLPVILATARALHAGWQPVADRGIIATRAFDVFSSHMPLVGQYSFAGTVTGHLTYSLGPMLYWLLAPAAHFGAPASLALTMGAVNVGSILGAVALARRRGGRWLMFAAAAAIGLMCRSLAASNFYDIWNPSAGLFPLTLLMFACWSLACGEYRLAPATVLVGSFCAQCEDAFIPPSLALLGVGAVGLALSCGRPRRLPSRRRPDPAPPVQPAGRRERHAAERRRFWRWLLAALAVLLVCWTPTIADQLAGGGNLGLVLRAAAERRTSLGPTVGARAVIHTVGVQPWWLTRPRSPWARKLDVRRPARLGTSLSALLILGWLVLALALALRRRRSDLAAGAALALALCAAIWSLADATPTTPLLAATLGYTLWWATPAGMFVWLIAGWSAVALLRESRLASALAARLRVRSRAAPHARGLLASAVGVGAVALGAGIGIAAAEPDEHGFEFPALGAINSRLGAVPSGHTVLLAARLDGVVTPLRPEITFALRRRGVRALGSGAYLRLGHWYEKWSHPYDYVVWIYDHGPPPVSGAKLIARVRIGGQHERHTVSVVIAPVASPAAWSRARVLDRCPLAGGPLVVFPSDSPSSPTGDGAIVWTSDRARCAPRAASAPRSRASLMLAPLQAGDPLPSAGARSLAVDAATGTTGAGSERALAAVGASRGRIAVAATAGSRAGPLLLLAQSRATETLASSTSLPGARAPLALAHAYLGDAALATSAPDHTIEVRVQRYFERAFGPIRTVAVGRGRVTSLTAAIDFRADVLLAWQQDGAIYAHMLRASGRPEPTQRVGVSGPDPQLQALVSDNDHGMIAWSSTHVSRRGPARTSMFLALSDAGVRFRAPQLLAAFADPARAGRRAGCITLVRLSSENVLLAWTDAERGHYVVRAAPAVFATSRPSLRISDARGQAVLAGLAPGPAGEADALLQAAPRSARGDFDPDRAPLWVARLHIAVHDRPGSLAPTRIAAAGAHLAPSIAVDPASDRAVVAWRTGGARPRLEYALGGGAPGYRPRPAAAAVVLPRAATHWLRLTVAALAALAAAMLLVAALRRRRRTRTS